MIYHDPSRKVHKCFICPDQPGYISRVSLLRHQAKHGVDRAFSCDYCTNSYSYVYTLLKQCSVNNWVFYFQIQTTAKNTHHITP